MILSKTATIKGNSKNLKYYTNLGFNIEINKEIEIDIKYLSNGSTALVKAQCDNCFLIKDIQWYTLFKYIKGDINGVYYCSNCNAIKRKKTNNIKYGGNAPTCDPQIVKKIQNTNIEKYGVTCTIQNSEINKKVKKTIFEKYGVNEVFKSDIIKNKIKDTLNNRYGVDSPLKSEEIYNKLKKTNLIKYGVENIFQIEEIKRYLIESQYNKWGSLYVKTDDMKNKSKATCLANYGSENFSNSIEYFNRLLDNANSKYKLNILSYDKNIKKYKILCDKCNSEYELNSDMILNRIKLKNTVCLICNPIGQTYISNGENSIFNFLIENNIYAEQTNNKIINPNHLDIIIPSKNIAIEFNGIYWHNDNFKDKNYHITKYEKCKDKGYSLLQIWEDDWNHKSDIIKSIILNKIGVLNTKIYARNCNIHLIDSKNSKIFLNENHLQGNCRSSLRIGLLHNDELVSLMTFGKRFINGKEEYELLRFCNKKNIIIIGGASKIFKYFKLNYNYDTIVSYSDNSISNGDLYKKLGFTYSGTTINYYWCDGKLKYHRFNFNKKKLVSQGFDKDKTENTIMKERGFTKIWGAGNKKWIFYK